MIQKIMEFTINRHLTHQELIKAFDNNYTTSVIGEDTVKIEIQNETPTGSFLDDIFKEFSFFYYFLSLHKCVIKLEYLNENCTVLDIEYKTKLHFIIQNLLGWFAFFSLLIEDVLNNDHVSQLIFLIITIICVSNLTVRRYFFRRKIEVILEQF